MKILKRALCLLPVIVFSWIMAGQGPVNVHSAAFSYAFSQGTGGKIHPMPVVGFTESHRVEDGETLLDIARQYGLGYNEIAQYHPEIDPWLPKEGLVINIPSRWILPVTRHEDVVINIPEMRLYRFFKKVDMVKTYPIGIGRDGFNTPIGETRVVEKIKNPSWTVPPTIREKYDRRVMPPGPQNPLGDYWVGLAAESLGIHGTNFPWGVGRRVSHGCIRLYPEHIEQFYGEAEPGTMVEIIYAPVKVGVSGDDIFLAVHPDIYGTIPDMPAHAWGIIDAAGLGNMVDEQKVRQAIEAAQGAPIQVSKGR